MRQIIQYDIKKQCQELILRYQNYHNDLELIYQRNKKRIKDPPKKVIHEPEEWSKDKRYNPFYVLHRRKQIANSISKKILNGNYKPELPYIKEIPKRSGGVRQISVYQIPDSAVSDRFYSNLLQKNKHRFSSLSYAYRDDRNVHYAIQDIANELISSPRIFIAEFDFSNFFGSINHDYLFQQFTKNGFLISKTEETIIKAFLEPLERGIPLGTSISLFLANLICWKLDRSLEDEGIRFARYADDTIVWSKDYLKVCRAFNIISEFSKLTGIEINMEKSEGISLLQKKGLPSEFSNTKEFVEFLGYRVSTESIGIKDDSVKRIKKEVSYILYRNLIQPINGPYRGVTIPANNEDKDFLTAIMQIRRYLYGNATELTLKKYINGVYKRLSFKGLMSFYPLITDEEQMIQLDRWLISTILNVLSLRKRLFLKNNPYFNTNQFPFNLTGEDIVKRCKSQEIYYRKGLYEVPSFMRVYKALKIGVKESGIDRVMNPYSSYYYEL